MCFRVGLVVFIALRCHPLLLSQEGFAIADNRTVPAISTERVVLRTPADRSRWCTPEPSQMLASDTRWAIPVTHVGEVEWIRVHLRLESPDVTTPWSVMIKGAPDSSANQEVLNQAIFSANNSRWSARIIGNMAVVEVHSPNPLKSLSLCVDSYTYASTDARVEPKLLIDGMTDHRIDMLRGSPYFKYAHSVALVFFQKVGSAEDYSCTGFAITPSLFVTNHHCISSPEQVPNAGAWFDYEVENSGQPLQVKFLGLLATDPDLDYSLLRLDRQMAPFYVSNISRTQISKQLAPPNQDLILIQHPAANRKKIAQSCKLQATDAAGIGDGQTDFYHLCDASPGSSGSPVMLEYSGEVIGLHNGGLFDDSSFQNHNTALKTTTMISSMLAKMANSADADKRGASLELRALLNGKR
jgi:hypothetical protein